MQVLDVNLLVALAWPNHIHHSQARAWFSANSSAAWATCSITQSGFIRVSSNRRVNVDARTPGEAAALLSAMTTIGAHTFLVDAVSLADHANELGEAVHGSASVTDAHLVLLARAHGGNVVSFDRGLGELARRLGSEAIVLPVD